MSLLRYARSFAAKKISVMPVGRDKRPLLSSWKELQERIPTDAELVKWFSGDANIAIITGKISNLSIVDVDTRHGGTPKGLPPTLVVRTQSGGWHYYYRYLEGLPNKVGVRQGIDIRSDCGYVVAPPSVGELGTYEWALIEEPQPFPADILGVEIAKAPVDWASVAKGVGEGGRNETASKFIGKLIASFKQEEWESAVWLTVLNWNRANNPPLPESELRSVFNSITSRERKKKAGEVVDDAPVVLMSDAAKLFRDDTSAIYPTGSTTLDGAIGGGLRDGNLVLIVGETGMGKSTYARTMTLEMLDANNTTSVWFTFELTIAEMWEKFVEMGAKDDTLIYTPERYVTRRLDWLKKKLVEARDTYKCKVAYIDHLGFLIGEYNGKGVAGISNNLASVYSMICRDLKTIALEENMIIVLMWHLRKLPRGQSDVEANDVKDSSGILQECDLALSVSRDKKPTQKEVQSNNGYATKVPSEMDDDSDIYSNVSTVKMLKSRRTGKMKKFQVVYQNGRLIQPDNTVDAFNGL